MGWRYSRSYFSDPNARSRTPFWPGDLTLVRTWRSSGPSGDKGAEAERPERSAVVGDQGDRHDLPGAGIGQVVDQRRACEKPLRLGQGELDGLDRVVLVRGR